MRGGTYAGQPVNVANFADVFYNIASDQDPVSAQRVRTEVLSSSGFSVEEVGVMEGITRARVAGVPERYLDKVADALRDPNAIQMFEAQLGDKNLSQFVLEASDMWFRGALTTDLQVQSEMRDYALGLFKSGMQPNEIKDTLQQHMSTAYYNDRFHCQRIKSSQ